MLTIAVSMATGGALAGCLVHCNGPRNRRITDDNGIARFTASVVGSRESIPIKIVKEGWKPINAMCTVDDDLQFSFVMEPL
jgi:hypothetical protein